MLKLYKTSNELTSKKSEIPLYLEEQQISETEYAKGHYLAESDLHEIWEDIYKLNLKKSNNNTEQLIDKDPNHPETFLLSDSQSARQRLQSLVSLAECLRHVQTMPEDMCDFANFGWAMQLTKEEALSITKQFFYQDLTYINQDGQESPLVQLYKKEDNGHDIYSICVPRTGEAQKKLLELAGFTFFITDKSDKFITEKTAREAAVWKMLISSGSFKEAGHNFGISAVRVRQLYNRFFRRMEMRYIHGSRPHPTDNDKNLARNKTALYVVDPENGDYVLTLRPSRSYLFASKKIYSPLSKDQIMELAYRYQSSQKERN